MNGSHYHTCPLCRESLTIQSTRHGNVYKCPSCKGAMANLAVLRGSVGHGLINSFWREANIYGKSSEKNCPLCQKPMVMFVANPDASTLSLDICNQCQLIWFDKNGFEEVPQVSGQVRKEMAQEMVLVDLQFSKEGVASERKMNLAIKIAEGLTCFFT
jgi:Zn-finger nucleic acid-binding protein